MGLAKLTIQKGAVGTESKDEVELRQSPKKAERELGRQRQTT